MQKMRPQLYAWFTCFTPFKDNSSLNQPWCISHVGHKFALLFVEIQGNNSLTNSVYRGKLSEPPLSFQINLILHESFQTLVSGSDCN